MVTAGFVSVVVAVVVVLTQPSSAQPTAAHVSARAGALQPQAWVACPAGQVLPGPITRFSPPGYYGASWPVAVVDNTGRLTTAFSVRDDDPNRTQEVQGLWSSDVPASSGDPRLIRDGSVPHWPDMSGPLEKRQLGIDAAGNQTFAWREGGVSAYNEPSNVMVATRSPGGAWSAPVSVTQAPALIDNVQLAVNAAGAAVLTWIRAAPANEADFEHANVVAAYRPAGSTTWLPPDDLALNLAGFSTVGIDDAGNATLVYEEETLHRVRVRRYEPAVGWGQVRTLSLGTPSSAGGANLAVSPSGAVTMTWSQNKTYGSPFRHYTRRMTPAGQWLSAVRRRGGKAVQANGLAIGGRGSAVAAWRNYRHDVVAQTSRRDGSWRRRVLLAKTQRNLSDLLSVTMNRHGDTLVVWQVRRKIPNHGYEGRLWGRYRPAGGAWAPARRLSPWGLDELHWTAAIGPDGTAAVAWRRHRDFVTQGVEARQLTVC